ncbi:MAG: PcfJ domain-containing protein, partial [Pseudomonadota bacterium]
APLRSIAIQLGLPFWIRKLPPEAMFGRLPERLPPDGYDAAAVVGMLPDEPKLQARWLAVVLEAWRLADGTFASWVARQLGFYGGQGTHDLQPVQIMALFAWASQAREHRAGQLVERRWNDRMGLPAACDAASDWLDAVSEDVVLGNGGLVDCWLAGGRAAGYRFVPLRSRQELLEEADVMDSCVGDYAHALAVGRCRLFSVRRGSQRVATLEVQPHDFHPGKPVVTQLRGPGNEDVPDRVWAAVFTWLGRQASFDLPSNEDWHGQPEPMAHAWQSLWRPYWREVGDHPLLPERPTRETLPEMKVFARRALIAHRHPQATLH